MTKKIDRTVELVLRLESAARMSTGEESRDFKDAAHRLGAYAAACQGFSQDLADIAEAVGLSREECSDNGRWVRYDDHAAEVARLREALEHAYGTLVRQRPRGHDGDEESGLCDPECDKCDVDGALAHMDAALTPAAKDGA